MNTATQSPISLFVRFLALGLVSFGGPVAHIGYFHKTFVTKLKWLDDATFMSMTTFCQAVPGPASSQLGFAIGWRLGGYTGAIAAFLAFTLPSFLLMTALAIYAPTDNLWMQAVIAGLKLAAVVVVADACMTMFTNLCTNKYRQGIAAVSALALLTVPALWMQIAVIGAAAGAGKMPSITRPKLRLSANSSFFMLFLLLLLASVCLLAFVPGSTVIELASRFYQVGSLVFGGGHVVLPLIDQQFQSQLSQDQLLTGYAAAQAVPGPMFTFASFIGAELNPNNPWLGAVIATIAIFAPGFLLVVAGLDRWQALMARADFSALAARVNAAVVGLLFAALLGTVMPTALIDGPSSILALVGLIAVRLFKLPLLWLLLILVSQALVAAWLS